MSWSYEYMTRKADLVNSKYKCVYSSGKDGIGHKIFKCIGADNCYEIADWSGDFPDETDDGRLEIMTDHPITIRDCDGRISRTVKVYCYRTGDDKGVVGLDYKTYMFVKRYLKMDVLLKGII